MAIFTIFLTNNFEYATPIQRDVVTQERAPPTPAVGVDVSLAEDARFLPRKLFVQMFQNNTNNHAAALEKERQFAHNSLDY